MGSHGPSSSEMCHVHAPQPVLALWPCAGRRAGSSAATAAEFHAGPYAWWPHRDFQPDSHGAEAVSRRNRYPGTRGCRRMMLMLQFKPDACVWENSAACFKGDRQGRVPSVWETAPMGSAL